ncbi:CFF_collapsed_G0026280.mRNA.1.CDS.1 [Saccharomyces cerevisiae]|nr:CFF_collapsed_G0026280.mRNA.1.CDS.1 [Saccharomyces cerevisiae]
MKSNEEVSSYMDIVIANFNWKARQLVKEDWRILSQINYLVSEFEILKMANYKQIDKLRNSFYKTI